MRITNLFPIARWLVDVKHSVAIALSDSNYVI